MLELNKIYGSSLETSLLYDTTVMSSMTIIFWLILL